MNRGGALSRKTERVRVGAESGWTPGLVKVIIEASTEKILGVHIIASAAGDMLAEGVLAMEYGATAEVVARTCHAHPTVSEAVKEAAMDAYSQPINF